MNQPWAVMCCGCQRLLMSNNKLSEEPAIMGGKGKTGGMIYWDQVQKFESHEAVDSRLKALGWRVEDGDHRCPSCVEEEAIEALVTRNEDQRRGAYIRVPES